MGHPTRMPSPSTWPAALLTVASLSLADFPTAAVAQECLASGMLDPNNGTITVTSPDNLTLFDGCTTLDGVIEIDSSFTGAFILNSITNLTGITMDEYGGASGVTSIEMPNLLYLRTMHLYETPDLQSVQMPLLEESLEIFFDQGVEGSVVDLGSLKQVGQLEISGAWNNVTFDSLQRGGDVSLTIGRSHSTTGSCAVRFPSLTDVGRLDLHGWIGSISLPSLQNIGDLQNLHDFAPWIDVIESGMMVKQSSGSTEDLTLSDLQTLNGTLVVTGSMRIFDLGPMQETKANISVTATHSMSFYTTLESAAEISLQGDISGIDFRNIVSFNDLRVSSTYAHIDCSQDLAISYVRHYDVALTPCLTDISSSTVTPVPLPTPSSSHNGSSGSTNSGAVAGIAVVCVAGGIAGIVVGVLIYKKKTRSKKKKTVDGPVQLVPLAGAQGQEPAQPQPQQQRRTQQAADDDGEDIPPPYSRPPPPYSPDPPA